MRRSRFQIFVQVTHTDGHLLVSDQISHEDTLLLWGDHRLGGGLNGARSESIALSRLSTIQLCVSSLTRKFCDRYAPYSCLARSVQTL
jgi:hypothetical protein